MFVVLVLISLLLGSSKAFDFIPEVCPDGYQFDSPGWCKKVEDCMGPWAAQRRLPNVKYAARLGSCVSTTCTNKGITRSCTLDTFPPLIVYTESLVV